MMRVCTTQHRFYIFSGNLWRVRFPHLLGRPPEIFEEEFNS